MDSLNDLLGQVTRDEVRLEVVLVARLGRDHKARWHRKTHPGHLAKKRSFVSEELLIIGRSLRKVVSPLAVNVGRPLGQALQRMGNEVGDADNGRNRCDQTHLTDEASRCPSPMKRTEAKS